MPKNDKMIDKKPNTAQGSNGSEKSSTAFEEKVIQVDRVSRTVKGGKRMRFRALVVVGNKSGRVGIGIGKAQEVLSAVKKAVNKAKKNLIDVPIVNDTIPHEIRVDFGSAKLFFKPASSGTSVIAGSSVRTVIELAGIKNILSKILGTSNKINNAKATIIALSSLRARQKSTVEDKILVKKEIKNETPRTKQK
jgi:small subunit ribosomal protein S5